MGKGGAGAAEAGPHTEQVQHQSSAATGAPFADRLYFQYSSSNGLHTSISTQVLLMVGVAETQHATYTLSTPPRRRRTCAQAA